MSIINVPSEADLSDARRRRSLFAGDLFVYGPRNSSLAVRDAARCALEHALGEQPHLSQQRFSETEFASSFHVAASSFARSSQVMDSICELVADLGCDPDTTFVGGRRLYALPGSGFLPFGLGTPSHPHRDTWWGAPPCQVNWWIPVYDLATSASLAFHPRYWDEPVANSSADFDVALSGPWAGPAAGGPSPEPDVRDVLALPRALEELALAPDIRIACPAGGVILASAAQLHSMVPNRSAGTRFLAHFQTVDRDDLVARAGAVNLDAQPSGTALGDFRRCSDWTPVPSELLDRDLPARPSVGARTAPLGQ